MDKLDAISPIDGRYRRITEPLTEHFSERALMRSRIIVEGEYFIALSQNPLVKHIRGFSDEEVGLVRKLYDLSLPDAQIIKDIETKGHGEIKATNHDVKAVEYFMKEKLAGTSLHPYLEGLHFALTSEDTNNLAYALMLKGALTKVNIPVMKEVVNGLIWLAESHKSVPMLARTHGQPASPTTFGKEFAVFASRLQRQLNQIEDSKILVKLNGATGNYNAHVAAYPDVNWTDFTLDLVDRLNGEGKVRLEPNLITTQIEPHDTYAELFNNVSRFNTILLSFDQDMWRYISDGWIKQRPVAGEVGSSTMPHKVNPIDFENSEGNLGIANALYGFFSTTLPVSRLQRHLTDSTIIRSFGTAFGHSLIGYKSALKGLGKIAVDEEKVIKELDNHPEVIGEAIQTILRREGLSMPYERLSALTRGRKVTMNDFETFIESLEISDSVKKELHQLTPRNYTGIAKLLVDKV